MKDKYFNLLTTLRKRIFNNFYDIKLAKFWISILISSVVNIIVKVPDIYLKELNTYMVTQDLDRIKEG